ncbi:exodeoxyribonuclease VII large subunit [bacterium]|nr:MAG: exodeoxyribonuclease VII large subunit [bacterium]
MEQGKRILTVRELNESISAAVAASFPGTVWVKGEVQRLPSDAAHRSHVYFELHETGTSGAAEYAIPVGIMGWDRQAFGLGRYLDGTDPDLQLANKLEVCFETQVDFYAKFGKLSLKIVGVDKTFALGRLEARRREVLAFLEQEGLLALNRQVPLPELPLHVGLITAPGSAAEKDFVTSLEQSPFGFRVRIEGAKMQGERLQAEVTTAIDRLVKAGVDVIVLTRGGGARADLSWFDQQDLAVAIARCPLPVVTAIGHEIDTSIADLVAHRRCKTPTAAAEFLVDTVGAAAARVDEAAVRLVESSDDMLTAAGHRMDVGRDLAQAVRHALLAARLRTQRTGGRLQQATGQRLARANRRLAGRAAVLGTATSRRLATARARGHDQARRLAREAPRLTVQRSQRLDAVAKQVELLDPARLLARGYSITLGPGGKTLRRAAEVATGDTILTRLAEGELRSIVQPDAREGGPRRKAKKRGGKEGTGQKTLFR